MGQSASQPYDSVVTQTAFDPTLRTTDQRFRLIHLLSSSIVSLPKDLLQLIASFHILQSIYVLHDYETAARREPTTAVTDTAAAARKRWITLDGKPMWEGRC